MSGFSRRSERLRLAFRHGADLDEWNVPSCVRELIHFDRRAKNSLPLGCRRRKPSDARYWSPPDRLTRKRLFARTQDAFDANVDVGLRWAEVETRLR
jgi:hypothetical protein